MCVCTRIWCFKQQWLSATSTLLSTLPWSNFAADFPMLISSFCEILSSKSLKLWETHWVQAQPPVSLLHFFPPLLPLLSYPAPALYILLFLLEQGCFSCTRLCFQCTHPATRSQLVLLLLCHSFGVWNQPSVISEPLIFIDLPQHINLSF